MATGIMFILLLVYCRVLTNIHAGGDQPLTIAQCGNRARKITAHVNDTVNATCAYQSEDSNNVRLHWNAPADGQLYFSEVQNNTGIYRSAILTSTKPIEQVLSCSAIDTATCHKVASASCRIVVCPKEPAPICSKVVRSKTDQHLYHFSCTFSTVCSAALWCKVNGSEISPRRVAAIGGKHFNSTYTGINLSGSRTVLCYLHNPSMDPILRTEILLPVDQPAEGPSEPPSNPQSVSSDPVNGTSGMPSTQSPSQKKEGGLSFGAGIGVGIGLGTAAVFITICAMHNRKTRGQCDALTSGQKQDQNLPSLNCNRNTQIATTSAELDTPSTDPSTK